ncbi:MAG: Uma2 family endonuclease [Acidobacteria bacterium]|nr:Uma2 family endonuclease [Acidobacteriota bacterium]
MPVTAPIAEERVLLQNVSWETYERLLSESVNNCGKRFIYDSGELEIMVVYVGHENANRTLASMVEVTAEESGQDFARAGSTTFKREDLAKGFEPDSCYYFRDAARIRDKREFDMAVDPPPELVIEVDITRSSLNRFPIFAGIGVAEVWRYDGKTVRFHRLDGSGYRLIETSVALPPLTAAQATIFLEQSRTETVPAWLRSVRAWIREQK